MHIRTALALLACERPGPYQIIRRMARARRRWEVLRRGAGAQIERNAVAAMHGTQETRTCRAWATPIAVATQGLAVREDSAQELAAVARLAPGGRPLLKMR